MMTSESILTRNSLIDFEWRFLNVHNIIIYSIFISLYVFQKQLHNLYVAQWNEISLSIAASIQLSIVSRCCVWSVCVYDKKKRWISELWLLIFKLTELEYNQYYWMDTSIWVFAQWIHKCIAHSYHPLNFFFLSTKDSLVVRDFISINQYWMSTNIQRILQNTVALCKWYIE